MAFLTSKDYESRDIYLYYDFEEAFLRYDHVKKSFYLKLVNSGPEYERPSSNNLVSQVQLYGKEVSRDDYERGSIPKK